MFAVAQNAAFAVGPESVLEEVIVTARKVEERAQGVPASLQVLSVDFLDGADLTRLYELQFDVPGLVVNNRGLFGAGFALRGVTDEGGNSLAVATHLNGAYLGTANLAIARLFDMERIEVLKGPQGTLYGRNATGGSINLLTRAPDDEFQAELEGAYGSYNTARLQGHLNVPIESGALRLAVIGSDGDGYIRNSVDDRRFGENDFTGVRTSVMLRLSDGLLLNLMAQHVSDDGAAGELWSPNVDFLPDPGDIRLTTVTQSDPYLKTGNDVVTANLEYKLASAMLHSVTAFARNEVRNLDDCAGTPVLAGCVRGVAPARYHQWSQEFRLTSGSERALNWLLGAYYFHADSSSRYYFSVPLFSPDPINDFSSNSEESAYAVFGETGFRLDDHWRITGGLRLNSEEARVSDVGTGIRDNATLTHAEDHWVNSSWRLAVEYSANAAALAYASISTGFKSGGITTERLPSGEFDGFGPEHLTAYEVGIKMQQAAGRWTLNTAVFLYEFEDMQVLTTLIIDNRLISAVDNAAKAKIYGIDASGNFRITDRLILSAGLDWMPKRELDNFHSDSTGEDLSGNKISRAPAWTTTTSISYSRPVAQLGALSATLQYNFRSDFYFSKENLPEMRQSSFGLWNLSLRFEPPSARWYLFASGRNLTGRDYFNQAFIQSSPGYPDTYEAGFGVRF